MKTSIDIVTAAFHGMFEGVSIHVMDHEAPKSSAEFAGKVRGMERKDDTLVIKLQQVSIKYPNKPFYEGWYKSELTLVVDLDLVFGGINVGRDKYGFESIAFNDVFEVNSDRSIDFVLTLSK